MRELMACFWTMVRIRKFERELELLCSTGCVPGTFHSSIGQEAVAAGVAAACGPGDLFVSNHRGHGHLIAKGGDLRRLTAELFGRLEGYAGGRGGTQHVAAFDIGFMGAMGITGGGIPIATGLALALKQENRGRAAVSFFGDGATSQGTFHESLNMASAFGLPALYVCENNCWAMGTPSCATVSGDALHKRAEGYGILNARADGNDVSAVREAALAALDYIRAESRPFLLELATYRIRGHSKSDAAPYRPEGELERWLARDPIEIARRRLIDEHGVPPEDLAAIEDEAALEIDAAVGFAEAGTRGDRDHALRGVYATPLDLSQSEPDEPREAADCSEMTYREAVALALREAMASDPSVFLIGEDIGRYEGAFKVTRGFLAEYGPSRVMDAPISENSMVGVATGAALAGRRPVVEIMFMDFLMLALDQLANHAAKLHYLFGGDARVPLVLRTPAGGYRGYGATHSQSLQSLLISVPGLKVVAPSTPRDARGLLASAILDDDPVVFIEHKLLYSVSGPVPREPERLPLGRASVVREGRDLTIIAHSYMTALALEAAEALARAGVEAEVVDMRSLKPIDWDTLADSARKTARVLVVEEGHRTGGVDAEVAAELGERTFGYLEAPILRVAAEDAPIPTAPEMEREVLPSAERILRAAERLLAGDF